eukprot:2855675-Pyramimonas_sp.AAC.1
MQQKVSMFLRIVIERMLTPLIRKGADGQKEVVALISTIQDKYKNIDFLELDSAAASCLADILDVRSAMEALLTPTLDKKYQDPHGETPAT